VPVYISHDAHESGDAPEGDKREWQRVYHEANAKLRRSGSVHVYVLAPRDGEVIESIDIGTATDPEKLLARLRAVVLKLKTIEGKPVVKPAPQCLPSGSAADSLVLHTVARSYKGTWNEFPVEDWTVLGREEVARILPGGDVTVGRSWELDRGVTAKFLTNFLPNGFNYAGYHKVTIREQSLTATVVAVKDGVARARLVGKLRLRHKTLDFRRSPPADAEEFAEMPLTGYLDFEPGTRRVRAVRLLADRATARDGSVEYAVAVRSVP